MQNHRCKSVKCQDVSLRCLHAQMFTCIDVDMRKCQDVQVYTYAYMCPTTQFAHAHNMYCKRRFCLHTHK